MLRILSPRLSVIFSFCYEMVKMKNFHRKGGHISSRSETQNTPGGTLPIVTCPHCFASQTPLPALPENSTWAFRSSQLPQPKVITLPFSTLMEYLSPRTIHLIIKSRSAILLFCYQSVIRIYYCYCLFTIYIIYLIINSLRASFGLFSLECRHDTLVSCYSRLCASVSSSTEWG